MQSLLKRTLMLSACLLGMVQVQAQILDTVVFGDSASETAHAVTAPQTQVITGGLGQPARRMQWDATDTEFNEGGYINLTTKVDPSKVNYVTLKLWGSDSAKTASGILTIYQIENGALYQVGYRGPQSELGELAWGIRSEAAIPNRFFYTTVPLPLSMTQGRTSVQLRIVGAGMNANGSLPVYRAYMHLGAYFEPAANDPQAPAPAPAPIRPGSGVSLQAAYDKARSATIANMTSWLANNNGDLAQLIEGYSLAWTPAYQNSLVPPRAAASIDSSCQAYFADPNSVGAEWGGAYGEVGDRIAKIGGAGFGSLLDQVVDLGDPAGPATRRVLWSKMLKASRDFGRYNRRGPTTNQTIINDKALYGAQRGLVAIGSPDALPAADATRYLLESVGLAPWLGPDLAGGGRNSYMGANYFLVTPSGLTKENGYVSAYGEVYDVSTGFYAATGDERFKTRAVEMMRARSYFRYPMVDEDGYRSFRMVGPIDWRGQNFFPFDQAYGERGTRLAVATATRDPYAIGYAHQMFEDNQGPAWGIDVYSALTLGALVEEPDSGERLPNTEGQPDYAWADVDNGVVAIKRGEELTWIQPYWQSRAGLHSHARIMQVGPTTARLAVLPGDMQFTWNGTWLAKGEVLIHDGNGPLNTPHGVVRQAYVGDKILRATAPADASPTREEFIGRASFYATRYGRYLVGINMDKVNSYVLKTPAGFTSAVDLITKQTLSGPITVPPVTAVVLDLGVTVDPNPLPITPKFIQATAIPEGISVYWNASGGAATYTLKRATSAAGPFTTLASGLGASFPRAWAAWPSGNFTDTTAAAGTTYFYRVSAVNAAGESYDSPVTPGATPGAAVASVNALPAPWKNVNFSGAGSASFAAGAFTLTGGGGDFWGVSDGGHFVYQPLVGDGTLVARITSTGGANKTGIMIRNSLAANSLHTLLMRQGTSLSGIRRSNTGGSTGYFGTGITVGTPGWMKLERRSNSITSSWAPDVSGAPGAWTVFATVDLSLNSTAYVGLATTSGTPVYDNVTLTAANRLTPAAPDAPAGVTATSGNGNVTLDWQPSNATSTYTVKRATTIGGPYSTILATNLTSLTYTNGGLTNGSTFYYVVTASNAVGESPASTPVSGTPSASPGTPTVTVTGTQAVVTWGAVTGATSYTLRRSLDGVTWATVASGLTATSYTDPGLANGQSYLYSVVAVHPTGPSASSPGTVGVASPVTPRLMNADGEGTVARLSWGTVAGAATYRVKRASTSGGALTTVATNLTSPIWTDPGLTPNADYFYVVTAVNAAGESAASPEMKTGWGTGLLAQYFNNTASTGNPLLSGIDPAPANTNWGQSSPDPVVNPDNFSVVWTGRLEAPTTETYTFAIVDLDDGFRLWINGTTVIDSAVGVRSGTFALTAGQKYDIRAQFWDGSGAGLISATWSSPTRAAEGLPVSRLYPASLIASRTTGGTASASSQGATETAAKAFDVNNSTKWNAGISTTTGWLQYQFAAGVTWPVSEYRLTSASDVPQRDPRDWEFQGSSDGSFWTTLDTQTGQTFASRGLTKSYPIANAAAYPYYRLKINANNGTAANGLQLAEFGLFSPESLPAPPAGLTAAPGNNQVALSWTAVPGATKYLVKRSRYPGGPYAALAEVTSGPAYTDTDVPNGATYHYVVSTVSAVGAGSVSAPVSAFVAPIPATPIGLTATPGNNRITLRWNAVPWATTYTVKRSTTSGSGYANLATDVTLATAIDTTAVAGTTYYYVVTAANGSGTSGNSAQASALAWTPAVATASVNNASPNERPAAAFDGAIGSKWYDGAMTAGGWLQYQFENGASKTITSYTITSANDVPQRDPKDWQLQGSTNGIAWDPLDTRTAQTFSTRNKTQLYPIANPAAYPYYRLNITANNGGSGFGVQLAELALIPTLPSPWSTADIGATGATGAAGASGGVFTAVGSGADIAGTADAFRFVHQTATGDCSITARVTAAQNTNGLAKAGIMIRETLNANAAHVTCDLTPAGNNEAIRRNATANSSTTTTAGGAAAPYWVRLVRTGNLFTASRSADGVTWTVTSTQTVAMSSAVSVGLVDCSRSTGALALVGFDNVTVTP